MWSAPGALSLRDRGRVRRYQSHTAFHRRIELRSSTDRGSKVSHVSESPNECVTIPMLQRWMREDRRLVMTTAYDAVTARIADSVVDIILVGDSVGNVCLGF